MSAMQEEEPRLVPVFVVGVPRSGTTWIQRILASHPDAWPLVETYLFSRQIGLGALFARVPPPGEEDEEGAALAPPEIRRLFRREELVREVRRIAREWMRSGAGERPRFVLEKSPWHLSDADLIAEVLPEARFVHVLRDGRDVAVSLMSARRSWSRQAGAATVRECGRIWVEGVSRARLAGVALGERLLEVRYEEVKADPQAAYARLFDHCGIPYDEALLRRTFELTDFNRLPEPRGEGRLYRGGRVGDWRERFSVWDAWSFQRVGGALLSDTGYESDPWWLKRPLRSRL